MQLHQTHSLVLKTTSYRDKDLVVHFLTKEFGKKTGIFYGARSQRSAYRSMSEPFSLLGIEFSEKENADMITIRSADLLESHVDLRKNYHHFLLASYFTELVHISLIPDPERLILSSSRMPWIIFPQKKISLHTRLNLN